MAMNDEDWAAAAERRVLEAAIQRSPSQRWNAALCAEAAADAGLSSAEAVLLLPRGAGDLAALLFERHDEHALAVLLEVDTAPLKVRSRLSMAVTARIDAAMIDEPAVKRAAVFLASPFNAPLAASLGWRTADRLWRWAGDVSTDENHYTKRAILSAILLSTMTVQLTAGRARAQSHLAARIGDVMRFEKWKAGLPKTTERLPGWLRRSASKPSAGSAG